VDLHRFSRSVQAYPAVCTAILFTEGFIVAPVEPGTESAFDIMLRAIPPVPPYEAVDIIRVVAKETAEETDDENIRSVANRAVEQMDHPDFLAYLRGAMGAV